MTNRATAKKLVLSSVDIHNDVSETILGIYSDIQKVDQPFVPPEN